MRLLGHQKSPQPADVGAVRELVDRYRVATGRAEQVERLTRERHEVRLVRRHTNVVELLIGEQRLRGIPSVTRHAAALAVENRPSAFGRFADRALIAADDEFVEWRVERQLRALLTSDPILDISKID